MAKIMLVEDDKSLREIYSIRLVAEGYDIVSAGDGEEALSLAVQEKPDLIISDVMMPKISGFDMVDILHSAPETKDIKIIIMTALSSEDQRRRSESLGAAKHLVKSQCGIEDVIQAVHEVLGDSPNDSAHANVNTLNAIATPEGQAAANLTPLNGTAAPNITAPPIAQSPSAVASEASAANEMRVMNEMNAAQNQMNQTGGKAPEQTPPPTPNQMQNQMNPMQQMPNQTPNAMQNPMQGPLPMPPAQGQAMPAAPAAVPNAAPGAVASSNNGQIQNPSMQAQLDPSAGPAFTQMPGQNGANPVNFNQASVTMPVAMPTMQNTESYNPAQVFASSAQPVAEAQNPAAAQMANTNLNPAQATQAFADLRSPIAIENSPSSQITARQIAMANPAAILQAIEIQRRAMSVQLAAQQLVPQQEDKRDIQAELAAQSAAQSQLQAQIPAYQQMLAQQQQIQQQQQVAQQQAAPQQIQAAPQTIQTEAATQPDPTEYNNPISINSIQRMHTAVEAEPTPVAVGEEGAALTPQQVLALAGQAHASMPTAHGVNPLQDGINAPGPVITDADRIATEQREQHGGERVLQPIHDDRQDRMRAEMTRRFNALLEDTPESTPQVINGKQKSETPQVDAPQTQFNAPIEQSPATAADISATATTTLVQPNANSNSPLPMPPVPAPAPTQQPPQNPAAVSAPMTTQDNSKQEQVGGLKDSSGASKAPEAPSAQSQPDEDLAHKAIKIIAASPNIQYSEDIRNLVTPAPAPAAPAPTPKKQTIADLASLPVPIENETQTYQPAYITHLENDLSQVLSTSSDELDKNSMAARMAAELADDDLTKNAQKLAGQQNS